MGYKRLNELITFAGAKGTGKTTVAKEMLDASKKKHIVVDMQDHPAYRHLPIITLDQIAQRPKFNCRVLTREPYKAIAEINEHIYNMNIVLEDARRYIQAHVPRHIEEFIINHKQHNTDIIMMFHSLRQIPTFVVDLQDRIVLFHTKDKYNYILNKFDEDVADVHKKVNDSANPYEYDHIEV